jgi:hypothetical protein
MLKISDQKYALKAMETRAIGGPQEIYSRKKNNFEVNEFIF